MLLFVDPCVVHVPPHAAAHDEEQRDHGDRNGDGGGAPGVLAAPRLQRRVGLDRLRHAPKHALRFHVGLQVGNVDVVARRAIQRKVDVLKIVQGSLLAPALVVDGRLHGLHRLGHVVRNADAKGAHRRAAAFHAFGQLGGGAGNGVVQGLVGHAARVAVHRVHPHVDGVPAALVVLNRHRDVFGVVDVFGVQAARVGDGAGGGGHQRGHVVRHAGVAKIE